jgi:hypothetical protein
LEQEARKKAEQERAEAEAKLAERREQEERTGKKMRGREPRVPDPEQAQPAAKAQRYNARPQHGCTIQKSPGMSGPMLRRIRNIYDTISLMRNIYAR